ncbi:kinase-like protein [Lentinus tigrinus ALCF2SS1-7]|uniref:non-specific serine/threonine protein kinase n=1 Tax=Lentinus tigrinus ALCF2SS1-6 TaxID=1328759 RepID=A0A5C2RYM3_9APHY|nr:kinase-like protein [Lentinus tigrinus ALCF2SS1-6]RPD74011.1 kinase-like protein [Lentinus tigrinus ALCF2SS1-7]
MSPRPYSSGSNKLLDAYQLGDSLGKGAFGQVYRALNWATGETVAIKEITLSNIPKSEIGQIMSEIDLLKNLNHPNIVKYKGFEKTPEYLYIILEFCENGSLHNICKKFGKFPETLVGVYIAQVLEGLVYLHDQGVIHRDIKGANILTNKDGCVKLADFGVASSTAAGAVRDDAVVGSPYWMAPEVIEQSGATTASDIWSVGCTVIELLEGKPPYHFLDPMPALFRIVQDDSPPIPEGASPIVKDFLYHCFQKDCNLRISAKKLLRHPWMLAARKQVANQQGTKAPEGPAGGPERRPLSNYNYDEAVLKVQEWNEALKSPSRPSKHPERHRKTSATARSGSPLPSPTAMISSVQASSSLGVPQQSMLLAPRKPGSVPNAKMPPMAAPLGHIRETLPMPFILQQPEEQTDNWDDDFEEGISLTKLHALDKPPAEEEKAEADDNAQTIRPGRSPQGLGTTVPLPVAKAPESQIAPIAEDYSDLLFEEDEAKLEEKVADFKMKNSVRRGLFHPNDIKTFGLQPPSPGPMTAPLPGLTHRRSRPSLSIISAGPASGPSSARAHSRSSSFVGNDSFGREQARRLQTDFDKYAEDDDEDYEDVFGKANGTSSQPMQTLQLNTRLSNKSWGFGDDDDEEDPFAEIDEGYAEEDLEANLQRDKYARLSNTVTQLIDELTPSAPDFQLRDACDQLLNIIHDTPEMQSQLVSAHGMLAILEVLESRTSRDVTLKLLQIVNALVTADMGFLESFCLIGGIPVIMGFTSKKYPSECRLEASHFIRLLCHSSVLTLQMFISCRGLKVLVDLLDEDYTEQSELVVHALNGICSVFELQSPTTKNDFCRMFIREGLLDPLSSALLNVMASRGELAADMNRKIIQIILVFCQVSQSDIHVRNALGTRKIVRRLLRACELLDPEYLVQMLKAVKHLSMNATILEVLQNANAIEILVKILDEQSSGPFGTEMSNHIFQTCYNLCRLNKSRQEEAAQAGIIPSLKRVIESSSPLKQFALPILCDLASAGKSCRILLWQHDGLSMYLRLLEDPYFQVSALESILSWLQDETARIEDELIKPESLEALLRCFVQAKANSFENLLDPLLKIFRISTNVAIGVAKSQFFKRLIDKLSSSKAVVRLNLLRILRTVCDVHPNRAVLVERYGIYDIVAKLSKEDVAVLVRELAREIVPTLAPALKPSARLSKGVDTPKSSKAIAPKRMRRHASESLAGTPSASMGGHSHANGVHPRSSARHSGVLNGRSSRHQLHDIPWQGQERR